MGRRVTMAGAAVICRPSNVASARAGVSSTSRVRWESVVVSPKVGERLLASDLGVSKLLAVGALHLAPCGLVSYKFEQSFTRVLTVLGLRTFSAHVARLLTVAAGDPVHVARLVAVLCHVSFLATVVAAAGATLGTVSGEMALCTQRQ